MGQARGAEAVPDRLARFWVQMLQLQVGLLLFACAIATMLEARIGLDPWSSFHWGASTQLGLSFGRVTQGTGLLLIAVSWLVLRVRPGIGTICNMLIIGPWLDLVRAQDWFPRYAGGVAGVSQFLIGLFLCGLATGVYVGAKLGAGPRDGFVIGLAYRLETSIRATRIGVEITVLLASALIGGSIGLGTVLFALLMGPIMQTSLRLFGVIHDPSRVAGTTSHESR
jgi:uncharacterized membrane protein YczE